jgi:hypothetical protein
LGQTGGHDKDGNPLPRLVYVSREKRPGFDHHKKAGAMNSLVSKFDLYIMFLSFEISSGNIMKRHTLLCDPADTGIRSFVKCSLHFELGL